MTTAHVRLENTPGILQVTKSPHAAASSSASSSPAVSISSPVPARAASASGAVAAGEGGLQSTRTVSGSAAESAFSPAAPQNGTAAAAQAGSSAAAASSAAPTGPPTPPTAGMTRRPSFGLNFLNSLTNSIRSHSSSTQLQPHNSGNNASNVLAAAAVTPATSVAGPSADISHGSTAGTAAEAASGLPAPPAVAADNKNFMSNSPTIANFNNYNLSSIGSGVDAVIEDEYPTDELPANNFDTTVTVDDEPAPPALSPAKQDGAELAQSGKDKDGFFSVRLTPLIDHSSSNSGLYFAPVIRKAKASSAITIGRYTEKNKAAAHAPQGSSAPIVFKSKVVSRTHALFQCNEDGQWFIKDSKSSSGTFLNHVRLSPASQESSLMPLIDGDIVQLGMDYRGGTEEVYRCVKMRCEFNKSWQRKVNQFNLEIYQKLKNLAIQNPTTAQETVANPINSALKDDLSECAICLLKLEPCQALFISPCSHSWHYKCIRPIIIKSYPQFYCPNCRSMCDLETDIEDDD